MGGTATGFLSRAVSTLFTQAADRACRREEELELLLRRWSKAKSGEGQVVLLSGEPGIGKSRLTAAQQYLGSSA